MGCFPAIPAIVKVWCDHQVLTIAVQLFGPAALQAQCAALLQLACSSPSGAPSTDSGLTCGNKLEHLWASLQKVAHMLQHMPGNQS